MSMSCTPPDEPFVDGVSNPRQTYVSISIAEDLEKYRPGGFHPVHLGDVIHGYRIVDKLGFGTFSTVWLAIGINQQRYVSLKIAAADSSKKSSEWSILQHLSQSKFIDSPGREFVIDVYDQFTLAGPNGLHHCIVSEFLGPSISAISRYLNMKNSYLPPRVTRQIITQLARGVAYLHACGVAHGDMHFGNILLHSPALATWTPAHIKHYFGTPETYVIHRYDGRPNGPHAPRYGVVPIGPIKFFPLLRLDDVNRVPRVHVKIVDFGEAFQGRTMRLSGVPAAYAAPEVLMMRIEQAESGLPVGYAGPAEGMQQTEAGLPSDVWTLAVIMFEVLTGNMLFPRCGENAYRVLQRIKDTLQARNVPGMADLLVAELGPQVEAWILMGMLRFAIHERLTAKEVVDKLPVEWR